MDNNYYCSSCPYYYKGFDKLMCCEYNACECWGYEYYPDGCSCNKEEVEKHMANRKAINKERRKIHEEKSNNHYFRE